MTLHNSKSKPRIIRDNSSLDRHYQSLVAGDVVVGRLRMVSSEEPLLLDLVERGVRLIPSAIAQLASRSKVLQARIFAEWMLEQTVAVHDTHQMLALLAAQASFGQGVITKHDRKNAGMGIHLWPSLEDVYNQSSLGVLPYPFVVQPFVAGARDIRVIIIGEFCEAYWRENPDGFRNNLHCGGESSPCLLDQGQRQLCEQVMERGKYPYAHLDLMVTPEGRTYLSEINLRGGIRGAAIGAEEYRLRIEAVHQQLVSPFEWEA